MARPFRAWGYDLTLNPRALPWARLGRPFRDQKGKRSCSPSVTARQPIPKTLLASGMIWAAWSLATDAPPRNLE
jgi:hypothetical protein